MFLFYFILVCYGLTSILLYGSIFDTIRPKEGLMGKLFKCPLCLSFHVGWFVAILSNFSNLFKIILTYYNIE